MNGDPRRAPSGWKRPSLLWLLQTLALFGLWIGLSGHFELEFLALGALSAIGATVLTRFLFHGTHEGRHQPAPNSLVWLLGALLRFLIYIPWLAYQIVISNLQVVYQVLHPRLPIQPTLVEFDTSLQSEYARVLLAQSITVTPGTVTVDATGGKLLVHCLSTASRDGLASGAIQSKIAWVFNEPGAERVELIDIIEPEQVPL
ncbi:MAG: Na+/H+ antiporter subunit E [Dehalococcoidia bacterium]